MFERFHDDFEPSSQTREAIQYVRKRSLLLGSIRHPGLFGIHGYTVDWILFVFCIALEAAGLYLLFAFLWITKTAPATAFLIVGAAFIVDLLLAFYHHRFATGENAKLEIDSIIRNKTVEAGSTIKISQNDDKIRSRKRISLIFSVFLVVAALLKMLTFYGLSASYRNTGGQLTFVCVAYLISAIIHIKVTGYWMHAVWAWYLHRRDVAKYKSSGGSLCKAISHPINLPSHPDYDNPIVVGTHKVDTIINPATGGNVHRLVCYGLLFDDELEQLSNKIIDPGARTAFVLKAMEVQIGML